MLPFNRLPYGMNLQALGHVLINGARVFSLTDGYQKVDI